MVTGPLSRELEDPTFLNSGILKKAKVIESGTKMAMEVINRHQLTSVSTEVFRTNIENLLKDYSGDLILTDKWEKWVLEKRPVSKSKGTVG